jgi:hypothetical protein
MTLSKIWVLAEATEGGVAPITLEMLAKARELADTVEAVFGGDGAGIAATARRPRRLQGARHRRPRRLAPGVYVAAALAAAIGTGDAPDAIFLGTTQDGRDIGARLSVKLDVPVITNVTDLVERDGALAGVEPIFGGSQTSTPSSQPGPWHLPRSARSRSRRRSPAAVPPRSRRWLFPTRVPPVPPRSSTATSKRPPARSSTLPPWSSPAVVASARPRTTSSSRTWPRPAQGCPRRLPRHRGRRLGALQLPGRPDRQGRQADRLHRCGHLRCHPAPGRHEGLQEHHRHQQGSRGPDLLGRRPRHRG